jgi:hypothetical protein
MRGESFLDGELRAMNLTRIVRGRDKESPAATIVRLMLGDPERQPAGRTSSRNLSSRITQD